MFDSIHDVTVSPKNLLLIKKKLFRSHNSQLLSVEQVSHIKLENNMKHELNVRHCTERLRFNTFDVINIQNRRAKRNGNSNFFVV